MITTRYRDTLLRTLMDWTGDLGDHPRELTLSEREFLCLAHEFETWVEDAPLRYAFPRTWAGVTGFNEAPLPGSKPLGSAVRVGDSFQVAGPRGVVTVRCLRAAP